MLKRGPLRAAGAMSGTSLDGVDAAMLVTDGHRIMEFGETAYRAYTDAERAVLRAGLGHWPGDSESEAAAEVVEMVHAEVLAGFATADLVGFHGQTLAHDPRGQGTHQAGCGRILAEVLGLPVVWDFRSNDVRMGGEGAPLAPAYHFALAKWIGTRAPVAFLNLGGVGNLTWIDPRHDRPEDPGALLAFDTGPANAPINDLMQARCGLGFDADGVLAGQGTVNEPVLERFAGHRWFTRMPPKSLDRDAFADLQGQVADLTDADACATLTAIAAAAVARGAEHFPTPPERILVTGGGRRNPVMMQMIAAMCDCPVIPVEDVGLDGDMLEAQAFAFLAVRVARGLPTSFPATTGVRAAIGGGQISDPRRAQTA